MVPQSDMDFGKYLREARERRGITLRQIATATRISPRTLEALESNEIRKLPGGIFSRAFVRSYAHEVGLDPDETVRRFLQQFPVDDVTAGSPLVEHEHTDVQASEEEEERRRQLAGLLIALAIGIPLIALIAYFAFSRHAPPTTGADAGKTTSSGAAASGPAPPANPADPPGQPAGVALGSGTASGGATAPGAPAAPPAGTTAAVTTAPIGDGLQMVLTTRGACWMRVSADGTVRFQGTLRSGERQTVDARDAIFLEVGDAGVVSFTLNGRPGKVLGVGGQVVRAHIRRANVAEWIASP